MKSDLYDAQYMGYNNFTKKNPKIFLNFLFITVINR